jgi:hypothetical protein
MTGHTTLHAPTPEFRASLERQVLDAWRRESRFGSAGGFSARNWRVAAALALGVILGAGSGFASAQVRDARQRSELEQTIAARRAMVSLRLDLAKQEHDRARQRFSTGVASADEVRGAEAVVRSFEANLARLALDMAEVRATAAAPRDELWAPLVEGRDYVKERLTVDAGLLQQRLEASTRRMEETRRRVRAGVASENDLLTAEADHAAVEQEMSLLAQKLALRGEFHDRALDEATMTHRVQLLELSSEVRGLQRELQLAERRAERAKAMAGAGAASDLEAKRAEVEVLERRIELQRLTQRLRALESRRER